VIRPLLLVALLSCSACAPAPTRSDAAGPPPEPPSAPTAGDARDVTVRYWVAGCSVGEDLWRYRKGSSTVTCDARGRALGATAGELVWPDYLDARDLDTVIVEGDGLERLRFELWWSIDDTFSRDRSVAAVADGISSERRFELREAPAWSGLVRRFRLTWSGEPSSSSRVVAAWGRKRASG
jgi:hypothetical protein